MNTVLGWIEVFNIFAKYVEPDDVLGINAEHDVIYGGPDPAIVSEEDLKRLNELGWFISKEFECLTRFV